MVYDHVISCLSLDEEIMRQKEEVRVCGEDVKMRPPILIQMTEVFAW